VERERKGSVRETEEIMGFLCGDSVSGYPRLNSAIMRRYYHLPLQSFDPGASGATWTSPDANTLSGWQLDAASETLEFQTDVHDDWDGASDLTIESVFTVNVDNSGGAPTDTVDLKLVCYYKGQGETATKTQTVEVATVIGTCAQWTQFKVEFDIDWDKASNVVQAGDVFSFILNLETDTSEVDNVTINDAAFHYHTTQGI